MPLRIEKLYSLLAEKDLFPKKYFKIHGLCVFIEAISIRTADTFMISIPSKYKFELRSGNNIFRLKAVDVDSKEEITDEYAKSPDNIELEKKYSEIDLDNDLPFKNQHGNRQISMAERLIETYKRPVSLRDLAKQDTLNIKDIFRQLKRLRYCVQSIRYKLTIVYKSYLCVLNLDDSIECFYIRNYDADERRRLLITCDLELLYEKINTIEEDIRQVRKGIYKVLDKNQLTHTKNLQLLLEKRADVGILSKDIFQKKEYIKEYIKSFESLLAQITSSETKVMQEIHSLKGQNANSVYGDIEYSHQKKRLEDKLIEIESTKDNVIRSITKLKDKMENTALTIDKILFDNIVMLDSIFQNFDELTKLSK